MNTKWIRLYECFNEYDWQIFKITASLDINTALNYASLVMKKGVIASQKDLLPIWLVGRLWKYLFLGYLVTLLYLYVIFYRIDFFLSWAIIDTVLWVNIFHCFLLPRKHLKISGMSSRRLQAMSWKTSWRCLQYNKFWSSKKSSRWLANLSSSRLGTKYIVMLNTSSRQILKTSSRQALKHF